MGAKRKRFLSYEKNEFYKSTYSKPKQQLTTSILVLEEENLDQQNPDSFDNQMKKPE